MKIKKVEIQGFRAYATKANGTFDLTIDGENASNFIAIFAPNGFGKSSFYDAIEWGMTNNIHRFLHKEYRTNNELAAKGTKKPGEPQYIIRNKDVGNKTPTSVRIQTTIEEFDRELPKVRGRDFTFREDQTVPGSESLRKVILSQDGIERFMREETPQNRYIYFMKYFGGKSEDYRKKVSVLISDNQNILEQLNSDKNGLEVELSRPIDESIFEAFNSEAIYLNSLGESINPIFPIITESVERESLILIVGRLRELKSNQDSYLSKKTTLETQLSKLPEIINIEKEIPVFKEKLKSLQAVIKSTEELEMLQQQILIGKESLETNFRKLAELNSIGDAIPKYVSISEELRLSLKHITKYFVSTKDLSSNLAKDQSTLKSLIDQLTDVDGKIREQGNLLNKSEQIYTEILNSETNQQIIKNVLDGYEKSRGESQRLRESTLSELKSLGEIDISVESFLFSDLSQLRIDQSDLISIQRITQQINSLETQIENIESTQSILQSKVSIQESLILVGLEYLSNNATNVCPLCKITHSTADHLRDAIERSDINPELASLNKSSEQLIALKIELQSQFADMLEQVRNKRLEKVTQLQTVLLECTNTLNTLDLDINWAINELKKLEESIVNLKSQTLNLDSEQFRAKLLSEIKELSAQKEALNSQIFTLKEQIEELGDQLLTNSSELVKFQTVQTELEKQNDYRVVSEYITKNGLSSDKVLDFHSSELSLLKTKTESINQEIKKSDVALENLQSLVISENYGLNYRQLVELKAYTEKQYFDSQSDLTAFIDGSKKVFDSNSFTLKDAEKKFKNEIQKLEINLKTCEDKLNKFLLLKDHLEIIRPYVHRTKLHDELEKVKSKITSHALLKSQLEDELGKVLESLEQQIDAFFYTDLINSIYSKIDPHPSFKNIEFTLDISVAEKPGLNFVITDQNGERISPNLYFSAAQINILSLSVFLANALHAKNNKGEEIQMILLDDPIQAMDSINILSTIDLLRNLMTQFNKQLIVSTHDENFFELLKRKIPTEIFNSKFLKLESYGKVEKSNESFII